MKRLAVGAISLNQSPMDWAGNRARIEHVLLDNPSVSLFCFPELCLSGYGCEDMFFSENVLKRSAELLLSLIPLTRGKICSFGLPLEVDKKTYNTCALVGDGKILGFVAKHHLAKDGVYYEPRWFEPWPIGARSSVELAGQTYPIGDLIFDIDGLRIAYEICEDAWVANRFGHVLSPYQVDLFLNPSASHFAFGKQALRRDLVVSGSKQFQSAYLYANLLGNDSGRLIYDGARIIAQNGTLLAESELLEFHESAITTAVLEFPDRAKPPSPHLVPASLPFGIPSTGEQTIASPLSKEEELFHAVALGLFDYMRRSRSKGFVISLSGGVDSAVVAILATAAFKLSFRELGLDTLKARLAYWEEAQKVTSVEELLRIGVSCVYQASPQSGQITRNAAQSLANALGIPFAAVDIAPMIENYLAILSKSGVEELNLPNSLNWQAHDLSLQNIQARVRGPGIWLIANLKGALLLATSNRSEASVGYTTMDGDTCGGLSPIAGVDKAYLRRWLKWFEQEGPAAYGPIPVLRLINEQEPTAELRPVPQTDETDLMPYDLLDAIERLAIRDKITPVEILDRIKTQFPQHSEAQLRLWIERFHLLWARNQWKRERYAPAFHLDDESVDPKTWCRFPILSSGYATELAELRGGK